MEEQSGKKGFKDLAREVILPKVEVVGFIILPIAILFKLSDFPGYAELLMISLSALAGVYYLEAFLGDTKITNTLDNILIKVGSIASAVAIVGIQFLILNLAGADQMLTIGLSTLGMTTLIVFFKFLNTEKSDFYKKLLIHFAKALAIVAITYLAF